MPAIQYTPVRFKRGSRVHANMIYDARGTACGKKLRGRVVRIVDEILDCVDCMRAIADARLKVKRQNRHNHR